MSPESLGTYYESLRKFLSEKTNPVLLFDLSGIIERCSDVLIQFERAPALAGEVKTKKR